MEDISSDELPQLMACFSTIEKAEDYRNRLKADGDTVYRIGVEEIDPELRGIDRRIRR